MIADAAVTVLPSGFVTVRAYVPAASAGVVAQIVPELGTITDVQGLPPTVTTAPASKPRTSSAAESSRTR